MVYSRDADGAGAGQHREHSPARRPVARYFGLKEELVGISLKGGLRWMVKPMIDGWFLRMMVRRVAA